MSLNGARRAQDRKLPNRVYYDSALRLLDKSVLCGRIVGEWAISILNMKLGRATVESQTQSARSRASTGTATSDEIAQIWQPPQPDTKIEHNQLDTTRGHNTGQPSGRRDE